MSALIDYINHRRKVNIISIEEPIEYIHRNDLAQITQREIGVHTHSFVNSLRSALRQDPDIIAIGELRDLESISIAITAAETGHLVLGTLHSFSAAKTVDRIIGVFPHEQQPQIRLQLSENVRGIISQQLINTTEGPRRAAFEVMLGNYSIRKLIRDRKTEQIPSLMIAHADEGMITMDNYLFHLMEDGIIDEEEAIYRAHNRGDLMKLIEMWKEQGGEKTMKSRKGVNTKQASSKTTRIPAENL
jgi:twitching motility protein PilT